MNKEPVIEHGTSWKYIARYLGHLDKIYNATENYIERIEWVFERGVPAWERFNVQRVVSMAACIVDGHLIVGNRHFCPIMNMIIYLMGISDSEPCEDSQGFVDQYGVYMTRKEAWEVAKVAGQIKRVYTEGVLFSECYL